MPNGNYSPGSVQNSSSVIFCSACGQKNEASANFCTKCGKQIISTITEQTPSPRMPSDPPSPERNEFVQRKKKISGWLVFGGISGAVILISAAYLFFNPYKMGKISAALKQNFQIIRNVGSINVFGGVTGPPENVIKEGIINLNYSWNYILEQHKNEVKWDIVILERWIKKESGVFPIKARVTLEWPGVGNRTDEGIYCFKIGEDQMGKKGWIAIPAMLCD